MICWERTISDTTYAQIAARIEKLSAGMDYWNYDITADLDADLSVFLACVVKRNGSNTTLTITDQYVYEKLTGLTSYALVFDNDTLIDLVNS